MINGNKNIFKSKMFITVLIGICGFLLIIFSYFLPENKSKSESETILITEADYYGENLETKIKKTIEKLTGKNTIDVMITFDGTFEKVLYNNTKNSTSITYNISDKEENPCIIKTKVPSIKGVMIVCTSIKNESDFINIKKAVATVLNISENKIYIIGGTN